MKKYSSLIVLLLVACQTGQKSSDEALQGKPQEQTAVETFDSKVESLGAASDVEKKEIVLDHKYFRILYSKEHKQPKWVEYVLTKADLMNELGIRDDKKFRADPMLKELGIPTVGKYDYKNSGYDKGHLAPADDFKRTQHAVDETFVMSNMSPQKGPLNQQSWQKLESTVHNWACGEEKIQIISGPFLKNGLKKIKSGVSIPERYFKAVYDLTVPVKSICFIYFQTDSGKFNPKLRAVSVDECEKQVGYEFEVESKLKKTEKSFDYESWKVGQCG